MENLLFYGVDSTPTPLHLLIIIVVVGLLDDFLWIGCGESFFFGFFG